MIYIASPYSSPDPNLRAERSRKAGEAMFQFAREGITAFSPVFYGHSLETKLKENLPYEFWIKFGLETLSRCSRLVVLTLPGWEESVGVQMEVEHAWNLKIPISGSGSEFHGALDVTGLEILRLYGLKVNR
jgi:hypothetical protein